MAPRGDQEQQPPLAGIQQPPIAGIQQPPIAGIQQPPVAGIQQPPIAGIQPPVAGIQQPPIAGIQQPPVAGIQQPPIAGIQQPPVAGMQQSPISVAGMQQLPVAGMQQQPPVIVQQQPPIVVQQPIVVATSATPRTSPFMLRGVRFSNGWKCPGVLFLFMIIFGLLTTFAGFTTTIVLGSKALIILVLGVLLLVSGIYMAYLARRQYKDLPPDHPHRLKYGTGYTLPVQTVDGVTTYQYPPRAQIPGGYPIVTTGHPRTSPIQATGLPVACSPPVAGQAGYPVPAAGQMGSPYIGQQGGCLASLGGQTYQPPALVQEPYKDDLPPPYSEVIQDTI